MRKAKQIGGVGIQVLATGFFFAQFCIAEPVSEGGAKNFLPIPGEVPPAPVIKPAPVPAPTPLPEPPPKPNRPPAIVTAPPETRKPIPVSPITSDWAGYNRNRAGKVVLDGKLVDISTLTPLDGFLIKEHATLSDGRQTFSGAVLEIAEQRVDTKKVAPSMELRPALWRKTNERVFLLNYKSSTSLPGVLMRVYVQEIEPIDGVKTFKTGSDPTFEEWQRLAGR